MSESRKPPAPEQRPPCPRCGSRNVQPKGERNGRWRYRCKDCGKWLKEDPLIALNHDDILDVLDAYCFDVKALDRLNKHLTIAKMKEQGKDLPKSTTQWSDLLIDEGECLESGAEITRTRWGSMSRILVIDSMHRNIEKERHFVWIAIDSISGDAVHYGVTASRKLPAVLDFLFELKLIGGYEPTIVVCDLEPAIISAVRLVFPNAKIQGCTIHRMNRLYDKLRTVQRNGKPIKRISQTRLKIRTEFIELARKLIHSGTPDEKQAFAVQMQSREKEWARDRQTLNQYRILLSKLEFYFTRQELGNCPDNTNQCELANKVFSKFAGCRQGFKNLRAAKAYVKAYFAVYRLKRNGNFSQKKLPHLWQIQSSQPELRCQKPDVTSSQKAEPEMVTAITIPQEKTGYLVEGRVGATTEDDIVDSAVYDSAQSAELTMHDFMHEPELTVRDNLTTDSTKDEALKLAEAELQKLKDIGSGILAMLSSADIYSLKSPKAYVNRFEILARKLGVSPLSFAINKVDGSAIKLTNGKKKSTKRCREESTDTNCISNLELRCLAQSASQMANCLSGSSFQYADVKSYANEFYRLIHKRGKSPASSTINKRDGRIINVN
jgi:hypothetical protein